MGLLRGAMSSLFMIGRPDKSGVEIGSQDIRDLAVSGMGVEHTSVAKPVSRLMDASALEVRATIFCWYCIL